MKSTYLLIGAMLFGALWLCSAPALAQKKDAGEQRRMEQVRKLQEQNQQLQADNNKIKADLTRVETESKSGAQQAKDVADRAAKLGRETSSLQKKLTELESKHLALQNSSQTSLDQAKLELTRANELINQANTLADNQRRQVAQLQSELKSANELRLTLANNGTQLTTQVNSCSGNNKTLVSLVDEVSEKYRTKSCVDSRSIIEPLMGLRKAEFDRVAEEYRAKAGEERFVPDLKK
jgi:chromosome segregation ATPase